MACLAFRSHLPRALMTDSYWHYLGTSHFAGAVFENWESEFLQMGSYVLLTAYPPRPAFMRAQAR